MAALSAPRRKGLHPPSPTTPTISPFALRAMAAGIVSRYKTGLRLDTYRIPYTVRAFSLGSLWVYGLNDYTHQVPRLKVHVHALRAAAFPLCSVEVSACKW